MEVAFVMGMSGVGKTTFIKEKFPNAFVLDLLEFQHQLFKDKMFVTAGMIMKSYENLKEELLKQLENHEQIIVEHTLLKAIRREYYLHDLLQHPNVKITGYYLQVDEDQYVKQMQERYADISEPSRNDESSRNDYKLATEIEEIPTVEEGFHELHIVKK